MDQQQTLIPPNPWETDETGETGMPWITGAPLARDGDDVDPEEWLLAGDHVDPEEWLLAGDYSDSDGGPRAGQDDGPDWGLLTSSLGTPDRELLFGDDGGPDRQLLAGDDGGPDPGIPASDPTSVSNSDFLQALFGAAPDDHRPILVSFAGNPSQTANSSWFGYPWPGEDPGLSFGANNYFSLAVFRPDDAGQYRRRKDQFVALHAIMLDDLGGKVPMERLTLPPSWLLETSPGNHQAGYLLSAPLSDGLLADRLVKAIVAAGLCDPGANGPRARLARLPVAVNGKHAPPFVCRLLTWSPTLRYSVEELVAGLELELTPASRSTRQRPGQGQGQSQEQGQGQRQRGPLPRGQDSDQVWQPRPEENAILVALRERGLYKAPLGEGRHDITCPWVAEHTGEVDGGTAYFEPDDNWPIGGFKCHHGHCSHRHIRDLLGHLGVEISAARMKPTIRVVPGEIHRIVDAAERELSQARRYYQRGGLIVTVTTDPGTRETRVQEISQPALTRALAGVATWERYDGRSQDWVRTDPPPRHASVLFDATGYPHLPVLNGLARQPYLRPDGSLMQTAGYDAATGMFGVFDARDFTVPDQPTRADAEAALARLKDLVAEFSFADPCDETAALAAILTASIRPSLAAAPMFHVRAHMVGSGKSYLCELITAFATPQRGTPTTFPGDDEECRKLLLAELLRAPAVIEFDNLTGDLVAHKSLCTALTSQYMSGRILGVSKTATVGTRALFLSSGNNVGPVQDMTRRCITIRLAPQCEVPAARTFSRPHLVRDVLGQRGDYVSAALTIIRAHLVADSPQSPCKPLASYGDWSDRCRQPLLWLGCPDPTATVFEAMTEDPDRETLARFLEAWFAEFGKTPTRVRDAVNRLGQFGVISTELREILHDIAGERGEVNRRRLGWWIRRHAGRIVDGMRIVRGSGNGPAESWRIETVDTVSPVSSVSSVPPATTARNVTTTAEAYAHASRGA